MPYLFVKSETLVILFNIYFSSTAMFWKRFPVFGAQDIIYFYISMGNNLSCHMLCDINKHWHVWFEAIQNSDNNYQLTGEQ